MDEQMFCFQCEQAAHCTACTGKAGVCGKSADTAAAQDRLTGALISYASQLIGEGRAPAPEQALLLMEGLFTTITEWKNIHTTPAKKVLYTFTFPIFMLTYIPISLVALFSRKVQWKPIEHHRADQRVLETAAAGRNK